MTVDSLQTFTLEGLQVGGLTVKEGAAAAMMQPRTVISGSIGLHARQNNGRFTSGGVFTMEKGVFKGAKMDVNAGGQYITTPGKFTVKAGTIDVQEINVSGEFTMDGGSIGTDGVFGRTKAEVKSGGRLMIQPVVGIEASTFTNAVEVYRNGVLLDTTTNPRWPPTAFPYTLAP